MDVESVFMSDKQSRYEQLSCLMDGELDQAAAMINSCNNELKNTWRRYHLIRDICRDAQMLHLPDDFSSRVMSALEAEPVVFNPRPVSRPQSWTSHKLFKPVAGLAIAATVAAITLVSLQNLYLPTEQNSIAVVANQQQSGSLKTLPAANNIAGSNLVTVSKKEERVIEDDGLNAYLIGHMEHASSAGAQGISPYVRLAGYDKSQ